MNVEKPWLKPFTSLLKELSSVYPGTVQDDQAEILDGARGAIGPGGWVYPEYRFEVDGYSLTLHIGENASFKPLEMGGYADNVEYLRLYIQARHEFNLQIGHEGFFDRFQKAVGLAWEFQTGDQEFDKKYLLEVRTDSGKEWLQNNEFQQLVLALEPFANIAIVKGYVAWAQEITDESQLTVEVVKGYTGKLIALANLVLK